MCPLCVNNVNHDRDCGRNQASDRASARERELRPVADVFSAKVTTRERRHASTPVSAVDGTGDPSGRVFDRRAGGRAA